jgi:hypothetical protein
MPKTVVVALLRKHPHSKKKKGARASQPTSKWHTVKEVEWLVTYRYVLNEYVG